MPKSRHGFLAGIMLHLIEDDHVHAFSSIRAEGIVIEWSEAGPSPRRIVRPVASTLHRHVQRFARRLTRRSTSRATMMIVPMAVPCQNGDTPIRLSPLRIITMMNTPMSVPTIEPRPP